tara:strand:- start:260 stop:613 length:354 start_codon:yes stop_codon:yes gene_type:complete
MQTQLGESNGTFSLVMLQNGAPVATVNGVCPHCGSSCSTETNKQSLKWTEATSTTVGPNGPATWGFNLTQCESCDKWSIDLMSIHAGVPSQLLAIQLNKTPGEIKSFFHNTPKKWRP